MHDKWVCLKFWLPVNPLVDDDVPGKNEKNGGVFRYSQHFQTDRTIWVLIKFNPLARTGSLDGQVGLETGTDMGYVTHKDCGFTKTTGSITPKVQYSNLARNHSFIDWLLVEPTPLKNMSSSVGIIIPNIWKNKTHVPNHQPVDDVPRLADATWAY